MDQDWSQVVFTKTPKVDGKSKIKKEQDIDIEDVKKIQTISKENQEKIRTARTVKKIKQKDLAQMINVDVNVIQQYENGKVIPNMLIMTKLEKKLNIRLDKTKDQRN
tara:strand:+ start:77 stop:397 length:321 start_codon:yes stop_codon:yes gene_type:complete